MSKQISIVVDEHMERLLAELEQANAARAELLRSDSHDGAAWEQAGQAVRTCEMAISLWLQILVDEQRQRAVREVER